MPHTICPDVFRFFRFFSPGAALPSPLVWFVSLSLLAGCSDGGNAPRAIASDTDTRDRPALRVADAHAGESDGVLSFEVTLDRSPTQRVALDVTVETGTARARVDFHLPARQTIEFAPGVTRQNVVIPLVDDAEVEPTETLQLKLVTTDDSIILARTVAEGLIEDDDMSYLHGPQPRVEGDFVKLDAAGRVLPFDAERWSCVHDRRSGLVWEVKTVGGFHDRDYRYAWMHSNATRNGGDPGAVTGPGAHCQAADGTAGSTACNTEAFIRAVNDEALCGFRDWRLPERDELHNLVEFDMTPPGPTIDTRFFRGTVNGPYWSAAASTDRADEAWFVDFWDGDVAFGAKSDTYRVRLVHGPRPWGETQTSACREDLAATAPQQRFETVADGIRDRYTGLVWQRCAQGQSGAECENGTALVLNLDEAKAEASALRQRSGKAWRLPTIKELESIVELGCRAPSSNPELFPATPIHPFWSTTAAATAPAQHWFLNFFLGRSYFQPDTALAAVRLVRPLEGRAEVRRATVSMKALQEKFRPLGQKRE